MNRRSFLKMLGVGVASVAAAPLIAPRAAPLFVPSERLDFGVPSERLVSAASITPGDVQQLWETGVRRMAARPEAGPTIPMLMLDNNYSREYGRDFAGHKIPAGATLLVDRTTAERWVAYGVATPGPTAPLDLQRASAQRRLEKQQQADREYFQDYRVPTRPEATRAIFVNGDAPDIAAGPLSWSGDTLWSGSRPDPFQRMIDRQMAKLKLQKAAAEEWPD